MLTDQDLLPSSNTFALPGGKPAGSIFSMTTEVCSLSNGAHDWDAPQNHLVRQSFKSEAF